MVLELKKLKLNLYSFQKVSTALVLLEVLVNCLIINRVKYTEIDWRAYMEQVECFLNGTLNYSQIVGGTGPIVYPAGHLYIYTLLYYLTDFGKSIKTAQYIFAVLYIANLIAVFRIYSKVKKVPPYALIFMCCTSYRIHSIYVLRLFNDPVAMFLLYVALNLFVDRRLTLGCIFYSAAVSVKMNVLLFAPGLLLLLLETTNMLKTLKHITICGTVQIMVGFPFLMYYPMEYISRSFNLGRVFLYKWTVNWKFLPEEFFLNRYFHLFLLVAHLLLLVVFFRKRWFQVLKWRPGIKQKANSYSIESIEQLLLTFFVCNLIGIAFSRSLHYQFYAWYFHSLPFLLWSTPYSSATKLCILGIIELCWNTYPSTSWSSASLHLMHLTIIIGLFRYKPLSKGGIKFH